MKTERLDEDVTPDDRVFQTLAAATGKARPPIVGRQTRGTMSSAVDAEHNRCQLCVSATRRKSRARYDGAIPLRHLKASTASL